MVTSTDRRATELKAKLFRGFADPSRLAILEALREEPKSVGDIATATELGQTNVSNHLACLKDCGLVTSEKRGRFVIYRHSDTRVAELLGLAEVVLADIAEGIYACTRYDPS